MARVDAAARRGDAVTEDAALKRRMRRGAAAAAAVAVACYANSIGGQLLFDDLRAVVVRVCAVAPPTLASESPLSRPRERGLGCVAARLTKARSAGGATPRAMQTCGKRRHCGTCYSTTGEDHVLSGLREGRLPMSFHSPQTQTLRPLFTQGLPCAAF